MTFLTFIEEVKIWADGNSEIEAVILVGSYAQNRNRPTSDIDLCILSSRKSDLITQTDWLQQFGNIQRKRTEYYGAVTSIRVWYIEGFEVEFGIADLSWISLPLDAGTKRVLSDGFAIITDKKNNFNFERIGIPGVNRN